MTIPNREMVSYILIQGKNVLEFATYADLVRYLGAATDAIIITVRGGYEIEFRE